jgi:UDP-4-amino-4,6-dideoxy-N-acetyl-beta-L-altrosamine N-acetyltransferase
VPLSIADLELVRCWRNDPKVANYMIFRDHITVTDQEKWFASIQNPQNLYTVIVYDGERIGLSHVKNIDDQQRTGEGGIFIFPEKYRNSLVSYRVSVVGTDWCFHSRGLEVVTGKVLGANQRAIRFNRGLGHVFDPPVPGSNVVTCRLTREAYERVRPGLIAAIK